MEVVKMFNNELSSLYETRPPISKAKMTTITRTAIKAIKFYKHVVQSVEKFIQKCKPEYKVPGLYVIDSIVRQSRHQFTPEKDVFAPRFARNITTTFQHLFNCPHDDKGKIVRVLNLWQKNQVFTPEVIQPLLDMASREQPVTNGVQPRPPGVESKPSPVKDASWLGGTENASTTPQPVTAPSSSKIVSNTPGLDQLTPVRRLVSYLLHATPRVSPHLTVGRSVRNSSDGERCLSVGQEMGRTGPTRSHSVKFDKKLLDFDYGEEEDEEASPQPTQPLPSLDSLTSILSNPEVLRQLQTLQAQMSSRSAQEEEKSRRLQEMRTQEEEFDKHLAQTLPNLPFASECDFKGGGNGGGGVVGAGGVGAAVEVLGLQGLLPQPVAPPQSTTQHVPAFRTVEEPLPAISQALTHDYDERTSLRSSGGAIGTPSSSGGNGGGVVEVIDLIRMDSEGRESPPRRRRRSSRSPRRSARSPSRSKRRRSRSEEREYERDWGDGRKSREAEREKERERRRKGLPPVKKHHLAVCSTTLWIGHLSKLVQQEELSDTFGEYGDIVSINLIPPRGCAFVCMNRRQDAARALHQLKHYKLQGKAITMAWAPGKGMKDREWKDYWEVEQGVSYIPWSKLTQDTDFELLEEGGMLDPDTFPEWLTGGISVADKMAVKREKDRVEGVAVDESSSGELDIPMPGAHPSLGYIPIPPPDPTPVSTTVTPIPPPMGIIPPFALPPSQYNTRTTLQYTPKRTIHFNISDNVSLMGMGMGGLMGNVPLGVPPPLMMPQQMVPRMPASPFNPPLLLGGGEKGKGGLGPASGDSFPDHLAPLVNPFGLPVPLSVLFGTGLNAAAAAAAAAVAGGPLILQQSNKGPAEMDVDDPSEPESKHIPPLPGLGLISSEGFSVSSGISEGQMEDVGSMTMKEEKKEEEERPGGEGGREELEEELKEGGLMAAKKDKEEEEERKMDEGESQQQPSPPKRQRRWPRVNRWGDSSPPPPQHDRILDGDRQGLVGGMLLGVGDQPQHHFPPPLPLPNRPPPPIGVMGGGPYCKGLGDRDERDDEMMFMPRGFFSPRGPPRPPRPLLRTPNGPMFGPRAPVPLMPMRGPRPGGRMEGMGFGRGRGRGRGFQRRWGGQEAPECA